MPTPFRSRVRRALLLGSLFATLGLLALTAARAARAAGDSVFLEELSSPELQARLDAGTRTVLIPVGGTEQSGPMALGKHNVRVHVLAGQIAQRVGNAVVAPVLAYVPEGTSPAGRPHALCRHALDPRAGLRGRAGRRRAQPAPARLRTCSFWATTAATSRAWSAWPNA
jgi:hypothetical protein